VSPSQRQQLSALCDHLAHRREAILQAWRAAARADPQQTTARQLSRGQLNDHIPQVLDAYESRLLLLAGNGDPQALEAQEKAQEVKHGLHRWQQGYRLQELMHEWGHLQLCLFEELNGFIAAQPEFDPVTFIAAQRQLITLVNDAIIESTGQYERLQQAEAAGHLRDLELAIAQMKEMERRRAALIHQAVHDLRGDVQSVSTAAEILREVSIEASEREEFAGFLQQGVQSVSTMLGELMELARLEAGQERLETSQFDVAALATELCNLHQAFARERNLYLRVEGPPALHVENDAGKVRRLLQNLLLNALKYTSAGGVTVSWGTTQENWWLRVQDTGPGVLSGPGAPMLAGLTEATASARESDEVTAEARGEVSEVLAPPPGASTRPRPPHQQSGEGIGLSIVKRLCELLEASLELASSRETGSTFRVVFPRRLVSPGGPG
jgi:signal transduction histidine kinase